VSSVIEDPEYLQGVEALMYPLAKRRASNEHLVRDLSLSETDRRVVEQIESALQRLIARGYHSVAARAAEPQQR